MIEKRKGEPRRWFVKAGALTSGALALGLSGGATAQQTETPTDDGVSDDAEYHQALTFNDEFRSGAVFRVLSPELEEQPLTDTEAAIDDWSVRVIEYFNTQEEVYLLLPPAAQVEEGELYVFSDESSRATGISDDDNLVRVRYRPLGQEDFPFQLEEGEDFDLLDEGGGEAAVRPANFFSGALFRITSGPQGWVPEDIEESGVFTDYDTVHAEYLGTNDQFRFFPQEDAEIQQGRLYVMWEEFEFVDPAGNTVAAEFDAVDEESLTVDDEFL